MNGIFEFLLAARPQDYFGLSGVGKGEEGVGSTGSRQNLWTAQLTLLTDLGRAEDGQI